MHSNAIQVLLIHGCPHDAALLQGMLRQGDPLPIHLECEECLPKGLDRLAEGKFDLLIMGIDPHNSSGIDAVARARARSPDLPTIVLVSRGSGAHQTLGLWRGAHDCLLREELTPALLSYAIRTAISRHARETHLLKQTLFDQATGAFTRESFLILLDRELRLARRRNQSVVLLALHTGGLARIAATIGPHAAQQVFADFVQILQADLRETDLIARVGPDEFAILASDTSPNAAEALAARVRKQLLLLTNHPDWLSINAAAVTAEPADGLSAAHLLAWALREASETPEHAQAL